MGTRLAAEDSVLVLYRQHVDLIDIQKIRRATIRAQVTFRYFESDARGILMAPAGVVHRDDESLDAGQAVA